MQFGCDEQDLVGKTGTELVEAAISPLWAHFETGFDSFSSGQQGALLCWTYEAEVNNGGLSQFFFNSGGDRSRETLDSLISVGAPNHAELLREAMEQFGPDGPPRDWQTRQDVIAEWDDDALQEMALESLDNRFFDLEVSEPLVELHVSRFVSENRSQFVRA